MIKRILGIILILAMALSVFAFTSCGESDKGDDTTTNEESGNTTEEAATEDITAPPTESAATPIILYPKDAMLTPVAEGIRVEDGGNLGYWDEGDVAEWTFEAVAGKYTVTVNYNKGSDDCDITFDFSSASLTASVPKTGDWGVDWVDLEVGEVDLAAGINTLSITGTMGGMFNVMDITLTPKA